MGWTYGERDANARETRWRGLRDHDANARERRWGTYGER